jgi:26S proteasome regulatory subunit N7
MTLSCVKDRAVEAQILALEKTPGIGSRIDIVLTLVRLGFFFGDHGLITSNLTKAEEYVHSTRKFLKLDSHLMTDLLRLVATGTVETDSKSTAGFTCYQFANSKGAGNFS